MTPEQLTAAIKESNRDLLSQLGITGGGRMSNNPINATPGVFDFINKNANGASDALGKMTIGTYTALDSINGIGNIISSFTGPFGTAFTTFTKGTAQYAFAINDSMREVSKSGYTFGQDMGLYVEAIAKARMSVPQFQEMIKQHGQALAGVASSADGAGKIYLNLAEKLNQDRTVKQMQLLGVGVEEFNEVLRIQTISRRNQDLNNQVNQDKLQNSVIETVRDMDLIAQMTGRSRQEQQKDLQKIMERPDVQLEMMAMDEEQRQVFEKSLSVGRMLGKSAEEIARITGSMSQGNVFSAEEGMKMATMDPEIRRLLGEFGRIKGDTDEARAGRDALTRQMELRAAEMAGDRNQLAMMTSLYRTGNAEQRQRAQAYLEVSALGQTILKQQKEFTEAKQAGKTEAKDFIEYRNQLLEAERKRLEVAGTPEASPEALAAQALNQAKILQQDVNAAVAGVFKEGVTAFGGALSAIDGLKMGLMTFNNEDLKNFGRKLLEAADNVLTRTGVNVDPNQIPNASPRAQSRVVTPGAEATGSKDVWGDWFNGPLNRLTYLAENEKEASVPFSKVGEFFKDQVSKNPELLKELRGTLGSSLSEVKSAMPTMEGMQQLLQSQQSTSTASTAPSLLQPEAINSAAISDLLKGVNQLNTNILAVKSAIEIGAEMSVKAVKRTGNLLA